MPKYIFNKTNIFVAGRYSPVRRASEGSRVSSVSHDPFQECQQLQKGLAHRNLLSAQSPPLDNSTSLPGNIILFSI